MKLDGFSHTSLVSLLVANRTKFFLSLIVEAHILGLWRSLRFWWFALCYLLSTALVFP